MQNKLIIPEFPLSYPDICQFYNSSIMKFACQVTINRPLNRVVELFDSVENLKEWQDGFVSFEHISGEPGEVGAKSKLVYLMNNREMELIETVLSNNLPHEFTGHYQSSATINTMQNRFTAIDAQRTRWDANIEYTELRGLMLKIISFIFSWHV